MSAVPERFRPMGPYVAVLAATLAVTMAGLVWLEQSSDLATCGRRIANLQQDRSALLERRAGALIAHAKATDPRALERRARELGFGPPEHVVHVAVATGTEPPGGDHLIAPGSALAIVMGKASAGPQEEPTRWTRLLSLVETTAVQAAESPRKSPHAR